MKDKFKNKNLFVIGFEVLVILISIIGITLATSKLIGNRSRVVLNTDEFNVDYIGDRDIIYDSLLPIMDKDININSVDNVIRLEFSLRGVRENKSNNIIYDVMLSDINIDCSLLNEYTKFNLYKNGSLISHGNFSKGFDKDIVNNSYHLTNVQEDLPNYNSEYDKYVLIIWISETCDKIGSCEIIDQSNIINSKMSMKVTIALYEGEKSEYIRVGSNDLSCANKPNLLNNLIPVRYIDGNWVIASSDNTIDSPWYSYSNGFWANAVVTKNNKYLNSAVGTVINMDDVLGQFVWIPRYKYKTWNINDGYTDSYDAYKNGIDIIFESGSNTSGSVYFDNNNVIGKNSDYLTHPAFISDGFWISKYEMGEDNRLVDGNKLLLNYEYNNINELILNTEFNTGRLPNDLEWGAISYLSHSKYGLCKNNICSKIGNNLEYVSGDNSQDSTTKNVYGVYDMSGSGYEYVVNSNYEIGSAIKEIHLSENKLWYDATQVYGNGSYNLRGGIGGNIFSISDNGMLDKSFRIVMYK